MKTEETWSEWLDYTKKAEPGMYVQFEAEVCDCANCKGSPILFDAPDQITREGIYLGGSSGYAQFAPPIQVPRGPTYMIARWRYKIFGQLDETEEHIEEFV